IQSQVKEIWNKINDENIDEYSDVEGYWNDFYNIFGFGFENIDYEKDVDIDLNINSINN
ncbi:MAG: bifunctional NADH-specific enoyl-ACP reductase/trans-2-enoyl-CoA reductase, partial [Paludibacteraceae bacterium]|nr:bifunctional NADH-specific enoyl-ACP reductase/trans-2-enoyl-CoA reductase [Paludibacteraceae bacterium]